MHKTKKIIPGALAVTLLLGATPVAAELYGTWGGTGNGECYPHSDVVIFPWSVWKGDVYISPEQDAPIFEGEWYDETGNYGTFKGNVYFPPIEEIAIAEGEWTWYDPESDSNKPVVGGKFKMTFCFLVGYCNGIWNTHWPSPSEVGTMTGKKLD